MFEFLHPVLSDRAIRRRIEKGQLFETPLRENQFQPNSVDLTLATSWQSIIPNDEINGEPCINPEKPVKYLNGDMKPYRILGSDTYLFGGKPVYRLAPGEFILFASQEVLTIPNGIVAFVQGRSSIARIGVQTEQAGLIDAGFNGTITFEVYNETPHPIFLIKGMRVAQVYFYKAMSSEQLYGSGVLKSKYSGQIRATGSRIHLDPEMHQ